MKNIFSKLAVAFVATAIMQTGLLVKAQADELEQLRAQVQVVSDVIDAKIYEFSKKSTDKPAFNHADYAVARQRYYGNMRIALQDFKNEVLEIYGRFEPYFQVANSSYYNISQKRQMLSVSGSPLEATIAQAEKDYAQAFEKLLTRAMGDIFVNVKTAKSVAILCNSLGCEKRLKTSYASHEEGYFNLNAWMRSSLVIQYNQEYLKKTTGCSTFHCFVLVKSDMGDTLLSLWLELGKENRKFYFDKSKTESFQFKLPDGTTRAGLLSGRNCRDSYPSIYMDEEIERRGACLSDLVVNGGIVMSYRSAGVERARMGNTFEILDLVFVPLVNPNVSVAAKK